MKPWSPEGCRFRVELGVERRPGNALNVEIGTPLPRCTAKPPEHWEALGGSRGRWLASGGSPLVFGPCTRNCPISDDAGG